MGDFVRLSKFGTHLCAAGALLVACSLQNFDYLQDGGTGGTSAGTAGSNNAGASASAGGTTILGEAGATLQGDAGRTSSPQGGKGGTPPETQMGEAGEPAFVGGAGGAAGADTGNMGTGAVGELVNPSFETGNTMGWTVLPAEALTKKHAYVQWPVGGGSVPEGHYEFSTWHETDAFTVELSQTIKGLSDGTYTFKGYFSRGDGFNSVTMFARNCGSTDPAPVPIPLTEPTQWLDVEVTGIEVVGGSCEVGIAIDSKPTNWLNADLFTFQKELTTN
jgi:hypothetical protein